MSGILHIYSWHLIVTLCHLTFAFCDLISLVLPLLPVPALLPWYTLPGHMTTPRYPQDQHCGFLLHTRNNHNDPGVEKIYQKRTKQNHVYLAQRRVSDVKFTPKKRLIKSNKVRSLKQFVREVSKRSLCWVEVLKYEGKLVISVKTIKMSQTNERTNESNDDTNT